MKKTHNPIVLPPAEHAISRSQISANALTVLTRLRDAGYDSLLVGGCVRDLMLGREPKDFDVVTNAKPEEIRRLFRNARLIGRRFRLAHVRFGRDLIEVATYRANPMENHESEDLQLSQSGRLLRDNVYGTREEDAIRRDFTVNALYYDSRDATVIDYVDGIKDIKQGLIRMIGDARKRYREDPVRTLRAVRFAAKLGLRIEKQTEEAIFSHGRLLHDVPPARLFEEVLKLFHGGAALGTFEALRHYQIFQYLFPETNKHLDTEEGDTSHRLIPLALENTDNRINEGKPVNPAFLLAVMLWGPVREEAKRLTDRGMSPQEALRAAAGTVVGRQHQTLTITRRFSGMVREIWLLQQGFERRTRKSVYRLLAHDRFRAAYDFYCLRARSGEASPEICQWWTEIQEVDKEAKNKMIDAVMPPAKKRRRQRSRSRKS